MRRKLFFIATKRRAWILDLFPRKIEVEAGGDLAERGAIRKKGQGINMEVGGLPTEAKKKPHLAFWRVKFSAQLS